MKEKNKKLSDHFKLLQMRNEKKRRNKEATAADASGPPRNNDSSAVPCPGTPREVTVELTSRGEAIDPSDRGSSSEPKDLSVRIGESCNETEMLQIEEDGDAVIGGETIGRPIEKSEAILRGTER